MKKNKEINYKLIVMIETPLLLLSLIIGLLHYVNSNPSIKNIITLATTVKSETFTELYFKNHANLPSKVILKQKYNFAFTLHNLEDKDMDYPYEMYIDLNGNKLDLDKGSIFIKKDGYKTVDKDFTLKLPTGKVKVVVNLINKNQRIDFWIENI